MVYTFNWSGVETSKIGSNEPPAYGVIEYSNGPQLVGYYSVTSTSDQVSALIG